MSNRLTVGTKEIIPVDVTDRTGGTTNLSSSSPTFDFQKDDNTYVYQNQAATVSGMRISCLVDASSAGPGGLLPAGHYRLFVKFTVGSEVVRKGPLDIYLVETNG